MKRSIILIAFFHLFLFSAIYCQHQNELKIISATPQGKLESCDKINIVVVFDQAMTKLKNLIDKNNSVLIKIRPEIKGKYEWFGTKTLSFTSTDSLPVSEEIRITIPAGTKSLNGSTLRQDYNWVIETPRPVIIQGNCRNNADSKYKFVEDAKNIVLKFNYPISMKNASDYFLLVDSVENIIPFTVKRPVESELKDSWMWKPFINTVMILPLKPLDPGKTYYIKCLPGLKLEGGKLPLETEEKLSFIMPEDFTLINVNGNDPTKIDFKFSEDVQDFYDRSTLQEYFSFEPSIDWSKAFESKSTTYPRSNEQSEFTISYPFLPDQVYKVHINSKLKSEKGKKLNKEYTFEYKTGPLEKSFFFQGPVVIPTNKISPYPYSIVNIDSIELKIYHLEKNVSIEINNSLSYDDKSYSSLEEHIKPKNHQSNNNSKIQLVYSSTIKNHSPRNHIYKSSIDLPKIISNSKPGLYAIQSKTFDESKSENYLSGFIEVTNLAANWESTEDTSLIWISHLNDASPVINAKIEIRSKDSKILWQGFTNTQGIAYAPNMNNLIYKPKKEWIEIGFYLVVEENDDILIMPFESKYNYYSEFLDRFRNNENTSHYLCSLFTNQNLYRPGDTVKVKGIIRQSDKNGLQIPKDYRFKISIENRQKNLFTFRPQLNEYGSFDFSFPLKNDASTGTYYMEANDELDTNSVKNHNRNKTSLSNSSFKVEEFQTPEIEINSSLDKKDYTNGDTIAGTISGNYLFGAPLARQKVEYNYFSKPIDWKPVGFEVYHFGIQYSSYYNNRKESVQISSRGDTILNANGEVRIDQKISLKDMSSAHTLYFEGRGISDMYQSVSSVNSALIHQGDFEIGVFPESNWIGNGNKYACRIVLLKNEGKLYTDPVPITIKIFKRNWKYFINDSLNKNKEKWQIVDSLITTENIISSDKPINWKYRCDNSGEYNIRIEAEDSKGRKIVTDDCFYKSGYGINNRDETDKVKENIIASTYNASAGDKVILTVASPFKKSQAHVSIYGKGIINEFTKTFEGGLAQIELPILEQYAPNVKVVVTIVPGDDASLPGILNSTILPIKYGDVDINVFPKTKLLFVDAKPTKKTYEPRDTVEVNISVSDNQNIPVQAELTVSVVDKGVLNLSGYLFPNLINDFYPERSIKISSFDSRMHLTHHPFREGFYLNIENDFSINAFMLSETRIDRPETRKNFRSQVYWNPNIITDRNGKAKIKFVLPDNITDYTILVNTQTKDSRFGMTESSFKVSKSIILHSKLPNFIRLNDTIQAGVSVFNNTAFKKKINVKAESENLKLLSADTLSLLVEPGRSRSADFTYFAPTISEAKLSFQAVSNDGDKDAAEWDLPVYPNTHVKSISLFESSSEKEIKEIFELPDSINSSSGNIEISLSSSGLLGLSESLNYLLSYPYGCLEQRLSSLIPLIEAKDLITKFELDPLKGLVYENVVKKQLSEIGNFQIKNGGFKYWQGSLSESEIPYLSALATYTLIKAKQNGYTVDDNVLANALKRINEILLNDSSLVKNQYKVNALILYTLSLSGKINIKQMEHLYNLREKLPLFAKAYLLLAYSDQKKYPAQVKELLNDLLKYVRINSMSAHFEEERDDQYLWTFNSTTQTTALILRALIHSQPENPIITKVVRWILEQRENGCWRTTHENLYVVQALADYYKVFEKNKSASNVTALVDSHKIVEETLQTSDPQIVKVSKSLNELSSSRSHTVTIIKKDKNTINYGIHVSYYPLREEDGQEEGFAIEKKYSMSDSLSKNMSFTLGSVICVTLIVNNPVNREFVVIDDPLPAGFEVINTGFQTTEFYLREAAKESSKYWSPFNRSENYNDRVIVFADSLPAGMHEFKYYVRAKTRGKFQLPSTFVQGMYAPEYYGSTSHREIVIH